MSDRTQVRKYKIKATYFDQPNRKWYVGTVEVVAYDRDEAIAQFKERRWELPIVPDTSSMSPLGSECTFTVEPWPPPRGI